MAESASNSEIEDVLSSIRRLVSQDIRRGDEAAASSPEPEPDKLVLTPALRVEAQTGDAADAAGATAAIDSGWSEDDEAGDEVSDWSGPRADHDGFVWGSGEHMTEAEVYAETDEADVYDETDEPEEGEVADEADNPFPRQSALQAKIAELEALIGERQEDWEPDAGAEDMSETSEVMEWVDDEGSEEDPVSDPVWDDVEAAWDGAIGEAEADDAQAKAASDVPGENGDERGEDDAARRGTDAEQGPDDAAQSWHDAEQSGEDHAQAGHTAEQAWEDAEPAADAARWDEDNAQAGDAARWDEDNAQAADDAPWDEDDAQAAGDAPWDEDEAQAGDDAPWDEAQAGDDARWDEDDAARDVGGAPWSEDDSLPDHDAPSQAERASAHDEQAVSPDTGGQSLHGNDDALDVDVADEASQDADQPAQDFFDRAAFEPANIEQDPFAQPDRDRADVEEEPLDLADADLTDFGSADADQQALDRAEATIAEQAEAAVADDAPDANQTAQEPGLVPASETPQTAEPADPSPVHGVAAFSRPEPRLHLSDGAAAHEDEDDDDIDLFADDNLLDEEALREMVADIVRQELQGALGERITRNVRKLVRREIHRVMNSQDFE